MPGQRTLVLLLIGAVATFSAVTIRVDAHTAPQVTFVKKTSAYPETLRQPYLRPYTSITGGDPPTPPEAMR